MEAEHHFCDRLSIMFGPEIKSNFVKKKIRSKIAYENLVSLAYVPNGLDY